MSDLRLLSFNQGSNAHLFFHAKTVSSSILTIHHAALVSLQAFHSNSHKQFKSNMDVVGLVNFHIIHSKYFAVSD